MKASILILDYKKGEKVVRNVESILQQKTSFPFEVIVVDNSVDPLNAAKLEKLRAYPNVKVKINTENVGYILGNNKAAEKATGDYILIVNPDISWKDPETLQKLVDFMDQNPKVGIAGPKQINETDGKVAMTVRAWPKFFLQVARRTWIRDLPLIKKWVAHDEMQHLDYNKTQPVDWLQSSFWIVRTSLWKKWGGLNTDYFLFMADPDLCWKCWEEGYEVIYYPEVTVYADGIRLSSGGMKDYFKKWTLRQHVKDALKYQKNHQGKKNPRPVS
jgi:GT2 family glycosyltransferase